MNLKELHSVYFIGIGGIGMSALAKWFLANGYHVGGYDRSPSVVTDQLVALGAEVTFDEQVASIPETYKSTAYGNLIVYTPAIRADHPQLRYYQTRGATLLKRSQVLGLISKDYKTLAVAGTHGKTTTTSLLAHLLYSADVSMVAFLGGLAQNYNSNFISNIKPGEDTYVVVEADEFDRSFLTLYPYLAIVTNIDPDHLDIYGDEASFLQAFNAFVNQLKDGGKLFKQAAIGDKINANQVETYGFEQADRRAENIQFVGGATRFDYYKGSQLLIADLRLQMPGYHNVMNAVAAISLALEIGISSEKIKAAISTFGGVKRRFEFIYKSDDLVYIDDYAHHPTELNALLTGVRAFWPSEKITIVFQPHLYTRTRDFMDEFATSLSKADEVILLDIYPARELPIEGVTSEVLLSKVSVPQKSLLKKDEIIALSASKKGVFLTVGAGDIDRLIEPIKKQLETRVHV